MIHINDLSFTYKNAKHPALDNINLSVEKGGFIGIIGASGAGKSTLSYALNGIIPHYYQGDYYGKALVDNLDVFDTEPAELAKIVGSVLQDIDSQMTSITVEEEVLFGLENFGVPKNEIEQRLVEALNTIGILDLRNREIAQLSGGQKQKVAIAAIVALKPKILVLDEPTGELDPAASRLVFSVLKKLNEDFGVTVVIIEQKIMLLCEYVKKLVVMKDGKIILQGDVRDVLLQFDVLQNAGVNCPRVVTLYHQMLKRGMIPATERLCITVEEASSMLQKYFGNQSQQKLSELQNEIFNNSQSDKKTEAKKIEVSENTPIAVNVNNVSFGYDVKKKGGQLDGEQLINDANFSVRQGEFVAIVGMNGAGKSTLEKIIGGLLLPSNGEVLINGKNTKTVKHSSLAKEVGFLFQNPDRLLCRTSVYDEILLGLECTGFSKEDAKQRAAHVIEDFGFDKDASPFMLSRGERQRLSLACIIAVEPSILILDEPTTGLDYNECMHVMEKIKLLNQQGTTVIMVCHDMEIVLDFATRIITMAKGKILSDSIADKVFSDENILKQASLLPPQIYQLSEQLNKIGANK